MRSERWGRPSFLTFGAKVDEHLSLEPERGRDMINPEPIWDASELAGWEHRVGMSVNIA